MRTTSLLLLCALAPAAHAQVSYHFEGRAGSVESGTWQSFTLDVPAYVDTDTSFDAAGLRQCTVDVLSCTSVGFQQQDLNNATLGVINFRTESTTTHYYFVREAFTHPGQYRMFYADNFNPATLWVSGPPVPEPAAAWLSLAGLACLAWRMHLATRQD